jgi:hypothetical protein
MKAVTKALVASISACFTHEDRGQALYDKVIAQLKADGVRRDANAGKHINVACYMSRGVPMNEETNAPDRKHPKYDSAQSMSKRIKKLFMGAKAAQVEEFTPSTAQAKAAAAYLALFESRADAIKALPKKAKAAK